MAVELQRDHDYGSLPETLLLEFAGVTWDRRETAARGQPTPSTRR